jgi:hypothetical protein
MTGRSERKDSRNTAMRRRPEQSDAVNNFGVAK